MRDLVASRQRLALWLRHGSRKRSPQSFGLCLASRHGNGLRPTLNCAETPHLPMSPILRLQRDCSASVNFRVGRRPILCPRATAGRRPDAQERRGRAKHGPSGFAARPVAQATPSRAVSVFRAKRPPFNLVGILATKITKITKDGEGSLRPLRSLRRLPASVAARRLHPRSTPHEIGRSVSSPVQNGLHAIVSSLLARHRKEAGIRKPSEFCAARVIAPQARDGCIWSLARVPI